MKNLLLILILCINIANVYAQPHQFVNVPYNVEPMNAYNCLELNNNYYFLVTKSNTANLNPASTIIIYKTNLLGDIIDSIALTDGNITDTTYTCSQLSKINNSTIAVYSNQFRNNLTTNIISDASYKTFFIDTSLQIVYSNNIINTDTSKIQSFYTNSKIKNRVYNIINTKDYFIPYPQDNKVHITDSLGNFIAVKHLIDSNKQVQTSDIIIHPNGSNLISSVKTIYGWRLAYTDSNYNLLKVDTFFLDANNLVGLMPLNSSSFLAVTTLNDVTGMYADSVCIAIIDTNNNILNKKSIAPPNNASKYTRANLGFSDYSYVNKSNIYFGALYNGDPTLFGKSIFTLNNVDSNLNLRWSKTFGNDYSYFPFSYKATNDGGCFIIGIYNSDTMPFAKHVSTYILKIDSTGFATSLFNFSNNINNQVLVYPNPSTTTISFIVSNQLDNATATIFSSNGQYVKSFIVHHGENVQNISTLPIGNYFYEIVNKKGEKANGKFSKK